LNRSEYSQGTCNATLIASAMIAWPDPDPTLGECWGSCPPRKEHDIAPSTNSKNHLTNLPVGGGRLNLRMALHLGVSSCHPVHGPARLKIMSTSSQVRHPFRGMRQVCQWMQILDDFGRCSPAQVPSWPKQRKICVPEKVNLPIDLGDSIGPIQFLGLT